MIKAKNITVMAVIAALMASVAVAEPDGNKGGKGEGKSITREEALERAAKRFDTTDKNGDGVIDADEAKKRWAQKRADMKKKHPDRKSSAEKADTGKVWEPISRADALERAAKRFDANDKDGDGVLTPEERKAAKKADRKKKKEARDDQD
jgi:Ca2+-binding EF-hand superfamily protein